MNKEGIKYALHNPKEKRILIEGKNKFAIGNLIEIDEFNELNGRNKVKKYLFFTDDVSKGKYFINNNLTYVDSANKFPIKAKLKPSFEMDDIYKKPLLGLGATALAGTYAYQQVLLGSIYGALFGALGLLFTPFVLAYTLPLATKFVNFVNKVGDCIENKKPFLTYKQEKLLENANSYINIIQRYDNQTPQTNQNSRQGSTITT